MDVMANQLEAVPVLKENLGRMGVMDVLVLKANQADRSEVRRDQKGVRGLEANVHVKDEVIEVDEGQ